MLSPRETYLAAVAATEQVNDQFLVELRALFQQLPKKPDRTQVEQEFVTAVQAAIAQGLTEDAAIKAVQVGLTKQYGVELLDPNAADFNEKFERFYAAESRAIPDSQLEPKAALKAILTNGFGARHGQRELGVMGTCPLTGKTMFVSNFYVHGQSNMAWFIYGGAEVRGWSYLAVMKEAMERITHATADAYYTSLGQANPYAEPVIVLEQDNPNAMSLQEIFYDVTRLSAQPESDDIDLSQGAIDPYRRAAQYSGSAADKAVILDFAYRQSSLFGIISRDDVFEVTGDANAAALVVSYLAEEDLSVAQRDYARSILEKLKEHGAQTNAAAEEYDIGSTILRMVAFKHAGQLSKERLLGLIEGFFSNSVLKVNDIGMVHQDIYFEAMQRSLGHIAGDTVPTIPMTVLCQEPATNLQQMLQLVPSILGQMSWDDLLDPNGKGALPLAELLAKHPEILAPFCDVSAESNGPRRADFPPAREPAARLQRG